MKNTGKLLFLFLTFCLFCVTPASIWGDVVTYEGVQYSLDDFAHTAKVVGYTGNPESVISYLETRSIGADAITIYEELYVSKNRTSISTGHTKHPAGVYPYYRVTAIGKGAFQDCPTLKSVRLGMLHNIITIENDAFKGCTNLVTVNISGSLEKIKIEGGAFRDCTGLESVIFGNYCKLSVVGDDVFSGCTKLSAIEFPESLTSLGDNIFNDCTNLKKVIFLGDKPSLKDNTFAGTPNLPDVYYAKDKKGWTDVDTFVGKKFLVHKPSGLLTTTQNNLCYYLNYENRTAWVDYELSHQKREEQPRKNVVIPSTVIYDGREYTTVEIGWGGFEYSIDLTAVEIPATVTNICNSAFRICEKLTSVTFANGISLENTGTNSFKECYRLASIEIPASVIRIGDGSFSDCQSLAKVTFQKGSQLKEIGRYAFERCYSLPSIEIPEGVTKIDSGAFENCESLTHVIFLGDKPEEGMSIFSEKNKPSVIYFVKGKKGWVEGGEWGGVKTRELPENVANVPAGADTDTEETMIDDVKYALSDTTALVTGYSGTEQKMLIIPEKIKVGEKEYVINGIGEKAFNRCSNLTSIKIPSGVTGIGNDAFSYCANLSSVIFAAESRLEIIGDDAFSNCDSLTNIDIPQGVVRIGDGVFYECEKLNTVVFWGDRPIAGSDVFTGTLEFSTVRFVKGKKGWVDDDKWCGETTRLLWVIQDGIKYALYDPETAYVEGYTTDIPKKAKIHNTVNYGVRDCVVVGIGKEAFLRCNLLRTIEIPVGVTNIAEKAFQGCEKLSEVIFDKGSQLETIGSYAFENCRKLRKIEIPNGVTKIKNSAFQSCRSLSVVNIPASVTDIETSAFSMSFCYYMEVKLRKVNFTEDSQLKTIGDNAFDGCWLMSSFTVPEGVTNVGKEIFNLGLGSYTFLKEVIFLGDMPEMDRDIFKGTRNLNTIYFIEGRKGWIEGDVWEGLTVKKYVGKKKKR